jgi:DNA-binding transcriptional regulator GbsR (MarR family)
VDVLRLAKKKQLLDEDDYRRFKKDIFEKGRDGREVKKDLTALIKQREELEPDEARKKRREMTIRRLLSSLKSLKRELEVTKILPSDVLKQTNTLIHRIEAEIS